MIANIHLAAPTCNDVAVRMLLTSVVKNDEHKGAFRLPKSHAWHMGGGQVVQGASSNF